MIFFDSSLRLAIDQWKNALLLHHHSPNTIQAYLSDLQQFLSFFYKHFYEKNPITTAHLITLDNFMNLDRDQLRHWLLYCHEQRYNRSSVARFVSALRHFCRFLQKKMLIKTHAILRANRPKSRRPLPRPASTQHIKKILDNLDLLPCSKEWIIQRDRALYLLLYATGMRISEALALNQEEWNSYENALHVTGKRQKQRLIPLIFHVRDQVDIYLTTHPFTKNPTDPIFWGHQGKRLCASVAQGRLRQLRRLLGLPETLTPHALRHSCATHLLEEGGNLRQIQELLGHESLSSTQVYTRISKQQLLKAYTHHPRY